MKLLFATPHFVASKDLSNNDSAICGQSQWHAKLRSTKSVQGPRAANFFSANEDCISANHMARILIWRRISLTSRKHLQYMYAHVHVCTMYLKYAPYDWLKYRGMAILVCRKINRPRAKTPRASKAF